MKDPKDIKYETGRYDEEGNPIYITEAEFREHGIITEYPSSVEPIKVKPEEIKPTVSSVAHGLLWGFLIILCTCPIWGGCIALFILGISHFTLGRIAEGIVICIITGGVILAIFGFAIYFTIVLCKSKVSHEWTPSTNKKSDGIEGTYETFGYTKPNGVRVTHIFKKDD